MARASNRPGARQPDLFDQEMYKAFRHEKFEQHPGTHVGFNRSSASWPAAELTFATRPSPLRQHDYLPGVLSESVIQLIAVGVESVVRSFLQVHADDAEHALLTTSGVPTDNAVAAIRDRFSRYQEVTAIAVRSSIGAIHSDIQVTVILSGDTWDDELMDRLLDDEYEIRQQWPDLPLRFMYPPRGAVEPGNSTSADTQIVFRR